jgi:transketolase
MAGLTAEHDGAAAPQLIGSSGDTLREACGRALTALAHTERDIVVLDADIAGGTGMHHFRRAHSERFFQFGIAEQNMMAAAAGMAAVGLRPVVTTFAVFCLRALEQARLSIAYSRRNVKIFASHPGLDVGPDGASAQCLEDLAAYRAIPGMVVVSPADVMEMEQATRAVMAYDGPVYMRTGRSPAPRLFDERHQFVLGKGQVLRSGGDVTLVACGVEVARALQAAELLARDGIAAQVINMPTIKPLDVALLVESVQRTGCVVAAEDHNIYGGLGGAVAECLAAHAPCPMEFVGVRDSFGESGEPGELAEKYQLTAPWIVQAAHRVLRRKQG